MLVATKAKKMSTSDTDDMRRFLTLGKYKISTDSKIDAALNREFWKLPEKELTQRMRFVDINNNSYAPARTVDQIYKQMLQRGSIDPLDTTMPFGTTGRRKRVRDQLGTDGTLYGRTLLYVRLPRTGTIVDWPRGQITFSDPRINHLYTGSVTRTYIRNRHKSGFVVVDQLVDWGRMTNSEQFVQRKRPRRRTLPGAEEKASRRPAKPDY